MINWQTGTTPINETNMNKLVQEDMITDAYSSLQTYAVGDYCIYGNTLYKCTTAITTAEAWNSAHWTAVTVTDEIKESAVAISSTQPSTEEKVWFKKGKNLCKGNFSNGTISTIEVSNRLFTYQNIELKAGVQYTFSTNMNLSTYKYAITYSTNKFPTSSTEYDSGWQTTSSFTFTPTVNCYLGIGIAKTDGTSELSPTNISSYNFQVEQGSTATSYEAYIPKKILTKNSNNVFEEFYNEENVNQESYSLGEIRIGTWIDGKPLYRKVIQTTTPTVATNGTSAWQQVVMQNVKFGRVTDCQMLSNVSNGTLLSPITRSTLAAGLNQFISVSFVNNTSNNTGVFQIESSSTTYNNRTVYAVIEYTKTTD